MTDKMKIKSLQDASGHEQVIFLLLMCFNESIQNEIVSALEKFLC